MLKGKILQFPHCVLIIHLTFYHFTNCQSRAKNHFKGYIPGTQEKYPQMLNICLGPDMLNMCLTYVKHMLNTHMLNTWVFYVLNTC